MSDALMPVADSLLQDCRLLYSSPLLVTLIHLTLPAAAITHIHKSIALGWTPGTSPHSMNASSTAAPVINCLHAFGTSSWKFDRVFAQLQRELLPTSLLLHTNQPYQLWQERHFLHPLQLPQPPNFLLISWPPPNSCIYPPTLLIDPWLWSWQEKASI